MWHEARKQERIIRGMIVDYRRRAERRKDFYEKIKAEPTQFLQLHGRPCKIHLDPAVAAAGEGPAIMMPWQGDNGNIIDRFDVRAHLDYITEVNNPDIPISELNQEERQCNYERYRILAQNAFLGISEDKFLQQLAIEEQFGVTIEEKELQKEKLNEKKGTGAAIGYNYNDPGAQPSCSNGPDVKNTESKDSDEDSDLEIIDVDLSIDVNKMAAQQAHELNAVGPQFGMDGCDLFSFLTGDADDAEYQKQLLREEKEKAMFSGRKSRRERRAHRDKKLAARTMSPPSYAEPRARASRSPSRSASRSVSPAPDTIQFITSFGPDEEKPPAPQKPLYADKLKQNLKTKASYSEAVRKPKTRSGSEERPISQIEQGEPNSRSRSRSRSKSKPRSHPRDRSRSRSRSWKSRSRSRSYSRSRSVSSRSRSRSYSPYRRSRSRSRPRYYNRRSRSPSNIASGFANMSRSMSYESFKGVAGGTHRIHEASNLTLKSSNALVTDFNHINSNDRSSHPSKPTVPRYYGRRKEDKSSSELSMISESEDSGDENNISAVGKSNTDQNQLRLSGSSSKGLSRETLTLKEKLKRKMQAQLSRQLRADKRAEAERLARESRRQARRDQEMRELAIKLRRKQREMRHQQNKLSSDDDCDRSRSDSSSRHSPTMEKKRQSPVREKRREIRSKTKSPSPARSCPVWETNREPFPHPHRSKPSEEPRRKYEDNAPYRMEGRYTDDRPQNYVRYDRYPNRYESNDYGQRGYDNQNRYEQPRETRWDQDNRNYYGPGRRRPYGGYRGGGGFRGQYRPGYGQAYGQGDGPSHWQNNTFSQDDGRPSGSQAKGKVKLVDY